VNTSYIWTRATTTNISNSPGSGSGSISETLINTSSSQVSVPYTYTLQADGCSFTQSLTVRVNPTPEMNVSLTAPDICTGSTFTYNPSSNAPGTVFEWHRNIVTDISNGEGFGSGNPNEKLVNTSNAIITVPYVYTLTANGCTNTQTVSVAVKPAPNIANMIAGTCSGTSVTVSPSNVPAGTTYSWLTPVYFPAGLISGGSAGASASNITQLLNNTSAAPATATYTVLPSAAGCTGNTFTLDISVAYVPMLPALLPHLLFAAARYSAIHLHPIPQAHHLPGRATLLPASAMPLHRVLTTLMKHW
jgi:hypothetical protein